MMTYRSTGRVNRLWLTLGIVLFAVLIGGGVLTFYVLTGRLKFFAVTESQIKDCLTKQDANCEIPHGLKVILQSEGREPMYYPAQDQYLGKLTVNGTIYIRGRVILQAKEIIVSKTGEINADGGKGGDAYHVNVGDRREQKDKVWANSGGDGGAGGGGGGGGGRGPRNRTFAQGACSTWESWTLKAYRNLSDLKGSEHFKAHDGGKGGLPGKPGEDGKQVSDWYPKLSPLYPWGAPKYASEARVGKGGKGWGYQSETGAPGGSSEDLDIHYVGYSGLDAKAVAYGIGVTLFFVPGGATVGITTTALAAVVDILDRINSNKWNINVSLYDKYNVRGAYQGSGGAGAGIHGVGAGGQGGAGNGCDNLAIDNEVAGGGGGGGGGSSVELHAKNNLVIAGKVTANGGKGGNGQKVGRRGYPSGAGGGGGGGSIDLILDNPNADIQITGTVSADGGQGGVPGDGVGVGNGGGGGYITYTSSAIRQNKKYLGEAKLGQATITARGGQVDPGQIVEVTLGEDLRQPDGTIIPAGTKVKASTRTRAGAPGTIEVFPAAVSLTQGSISDYRLSPSDENVTSVHTFKFKTSSTATALSAGDTLTLFYNVKFVFSKNPNDITINNLPVKEIRPVSLNPSEMEIVIPSGVSNAQELDVKITNIKNPSKGDYDVSVKSSKDQKLAKISIQIGKPVCGEGDVDCNGKVDFIDLQIAIDRTTMECSAWDTAEHVAQCKRADLNNSNFVDTDDLSTILSKLRPST